MDIKDALEEFIEGRGHKFISRGIVQSINSFLNLGNYIDEYKTAFLKEYHFTDDDFSKAITNGEFISRLQKNIQENKFEDAKLTLYDISELNDDIGSQAYCFEHPDADVRKGCFVDINGTVIFDDDVFHNRLVEQYLDEDIDGNERSDSIELLQQKSEDKFAFGSILDNDVLLLDPPHNMEITDVLKHLRNSGMNISKVYYWGNSYLEDAALVTRIAKMR